MQKNHNVKKIIILLLIMIFTFFVFMYMRVLTHNNGVWYTVATDAENRVITQTDTAVVVECSFVSSPDAIRGVVLPTPVIKASGAQTVSVSLYNQGNNLLGAATVSTGGILDGDSTIFDLINYVEGIKDKELKLQVTYQGFSDVQACLDSVASEQYSINVISAGKDTFCVAVDVAYILFALVMVAALAIVLFGKSFKLETVYLIAVLGIGLIITILIPLMAVPDEATHLYMAYELSNSFLGIDPSENNSLMMRYDDAVRYYEPENITRAYLNSYYDDFFKGIGDSQLIDSGVMVSSAPVYLYLFSGLGITLGRLIGLGTTLTFMLGRLFNLMAFALISYYAIRKIPFGKSVAFVWAMLPITLQQIGSYSYDCIINALSILMISMTLYFMYGERPESKKRRILEIEILVITALFLIPCKGFALLPLVLLPLMVLVKLLWDKKSNIKDYLNEKKYRKRVLIAVLALLCVAVLVIGAIVLRRLLATADAPGVYVAWTGSYAHTIGYYIKNPVALVSIFINTVWAKGEELFVQMIGGSLGWINIKVPIIFVLPFFLLLFYAGARREDENQPISIVSKTWMWIVFLGVCFLACMGMLLYWTPTSASVILGVQGRYFLPALVLPFIASRTKTTQVSKNADKIIVYTVLILYVFIITSLIKRAL